MHPIIKWKTQNLQIKETTLKTYGMEVAISLSAIVKKQTKDYTKEESSYTQFNHHPISVCVQPHMLSYKQNELS